MLRLTLAVVHLLALGVGVGAVYARARALGALGDVLGTGSGDPGLARERVARGLAADTWWGVSALLWIGTGLWRAIGGTEKSPHYYATNHVFFAKMGLLVLILLLELWPMVTLVRWRVAAARGTRTDGATMARDGWRIARVSDVQLLLLVGMVVAAVAMARGYGAHG